jgi:hypothetical protein
MKLNEAKRFLEIADKPANAKFKLRSSPLGKRAIQTVRQHAKPAGTTRMPNPGKKPTLIYGRILTIDAQKTQRHECDDACKRVKHKYTHDFSKHSKAKIWGLPNGDVLITGVKELWRLF